MDSRGSTRTYRDGEGISASSSDSSDDRPPGTDWAWLRVLSVCRYRTRDLWDEECSRFFDCPGHTIARSDAPSIEASDRGQPRETSSAAPPLLPPDTRNEEGGATLSPRPTSRAARSLSAPGETPPLGAPQDSQASPPTADDITGRLHRSASLRPPGQSMSLGGPSAGPRTMLAAEDVMRSRPHAPTVEPSASTALPIRHRTSSGSSSEPVPEYELPRWQPDAEVTFCPICNTQFGWIVRKHHCRKCGRVVCGNCSPHEITIPHQYIVRPPGDKTLLRTSGVWGPGGDATELGSLGGGQRVRLCNPCVPDPNTTPLHSRDAASAAPFSPRPPHQRTVSTGSAHGQISVPVNTPSWQLSSALSYSHDPYPRTRSATVNSNHSRSHSRPSSGFAQRDVQSTQNRILSGTPPIGLSAGSSSRQPPHSARNNRPLPPPPQIAEEDECPVCHRELPSRDLPSFESVREAHVASCVTAHSSSSGSSGPWSGQQRRTGMFHYVATEKDCVESSECTICLEEFEVGVPMARLECLCRYHRACIAAWFVKHPGRCPIHQHDTSGH